MCRDIKNYLNMCQRSLHIEFLASCCVLYRRYPHSERKSLQDTLQVTKPLKRENILIFYLLMSDEPINISTSYSFLNLRYRPPTPNIKTSCCKSQNNSDVTIFFSTYISLNYLSMTIFINCVYGCQKNIIG